jgi:hypothetical protein
MARIRWWRLGSEGSSGWLGKRLARANGLAGLSTRLGRWHRRPQAVEGGWDFAGEMHLSISGVDLEWEKGRK